MPAKPPSRHPTKEERLAAALRENLKRRKEAARARKDAGPAPAAERPNTAQKPG